MVGSYSTELKELRAQQCSLSMIEKHFLTKDKTTHTGGIFDEDDPDFEKIPFMHPDNKDKTFREHFDSLYSVCDPKEFTDAQCTDVMEIRMGGSYLNELKELKDNNADLDSIELHFLSKDIQDTKELIGNEDSDPKKAGNQVEEVAEDKSDVAEEEFRKIPIMDSENQNHTFAEWFEILHSVCDHQGLTKDQCLDAMESLMAGSYLSELDDLKTEYHSLETIEKYFLDKDIENDMDTFKLISLNEGVVQKEKIKLNHGF